MAKSKNILPRLIDLQEYQAPTVRDLAYAVNPISSDWLVGEVLRLFQIEPDLLILPVFGGNNRYIGAISRRNFLNFMTQNYAQDLFSRKTVARLLRQKPQLAQVPLIAKAEDRVDQTMRELLLRDPKVNHEALPVLDDNQFVGIITVTAMMLSLSESQEKLIQAKESALESLCKALDELVASEKLAALGSLVAGVAHELNTPIGNCVMVASTLSERTRKLASTLDSGNLKRSMLDAYVQDAGTAADLMLKSMNSAAELVRSFKQVSVDQTSEQRRFFDLSVVLKEVLVTLGPTLKKTPHSVVTEFDEDIALNSFPGPLGRVVVNLISNALVHAFADNQAGIILIRTHKDGASACFIRVSDNGKGIPPEQLKRIFEPFFTTRLGQGGSGLGLSIVYNNVVGLLGGTVSVNSEPDHGTEFIVHLPLEAPGNRS